MPARFSFRSPGGPLAVLALTVALPLSGLTEVPARAAGPAVIPQAPVLSVIAKSETLPFVLEGGGAIEVAVLTGDQTMDQAAWQTIDELGLDRYNGQTIRVLARKVGVTDPKDYFDATYTVRDSYPPAWDLGTAENPTGAIRADNTRFVGWATGWENLKRGPNVNGAWLERPVSDFLGQVAASNDSVNGATTHLVVLGDNGEITATFRSPITDRTGDDFAVFENGFRILGGELDFAELASVEVSSDGTHFLGFDSASLTSSAVSAFAGLRASQVGGLAGQYWTGYGSGFDLSTLKNRPEVRDGTVDLSRITHVKVKDIAGCGEERDSFGRPIYDPCGTAQSGGFDLTGIGVFNQVDNIPWIDTPAIVAGPTTATVSTKVTANGVAQSVWAELRNHKNPEVVIRTEEFGVRATQRNRPVSRDFTNLLRGDTYDFRFVTRNPDEVETATAWQRFVAPDVLISNPYPELVKQVVADGAVHVPFLYDVNPVNGNDFTARVEYSENPDGRDPKFTESKKFDGRFTWTTSVRQFLMGLKPDWDYVARVETTGSDGNTTLSGWVKFHTDPVSSYWLEPMLSSWVDQGFHGETMTACTYVSTPPGTEGVSLGLYVWDYDRDSEIVGTATPLALVGNGGYACTSVAGVDPSHSMTAALRLYDSKGDVLTAQNAGTNTAADPVAIPSEPQISDLTALGATFAGQVALGRDGGQEISFEYAPVDAETSEHSDTAWAAYTWQAPVWAGSMAVTGLSPATDYRVRTVSTPLHGDEAVTSAWATFRTEGLPAAVGDTSVSALASTSATVSAVITAGSVAQRVWVEYGQDSGETVSSKRVEVPAGLVPVTVKVGLKGLAANTAFSYRVVTESTAGAQVASDWASFATAKVADPAVQVTVSPASAKAGDTVTVSWKTTDATSATASGSWEGTKELSGTERIAITRPGSWTFTLTGTGEAGNTTTATTVLTATLPAKKLAVTGQRGATAAGKSFAVKATGLAAGEDYSISLSGIEVSTGRATGSGTVSRTITVPKALGVGTHTVTVTGSSADRVGTTAAQLVPSRQKLTVKAASKVKRGQKVTVKASGLGAYEPVTVKVGTTKVAATANAKGDLTVKVAVAKKAKVGKAKITLTGVTPNRTGARSITITR